MFTVHKQSHHAEGGGGLYSLNNTCKTYTYASIFSFILSAPFYYTSQISAQGTSLGHRTPDYMNGLS